MSFAVPVSPAENRRPATVTVAGYLLYLVAVIVVVSAILPLTSLGKATDALRRVYANSTTTTPDQAASFYRVEIIGVLVLYIILAVGISILAAFDLRGKQVARIITWVISGLGVLCLGCGVALSGRISTSAGSSSSAGQPSPQAVADAVKNAQPSWLGPTSRTLSVIAVLALVAVIILLTLPVSNSFFRPGAGAGAEFGGAEPAYPSLPYPPVPGAPVPPAGEPQAPSTWSAPQQPPAGQPAPPPEQQGSEQPPSDQPPAS